MTDHTAPLSSAEQDRNVLHALNMVRKGELSAESFCKEFYDVLCRALTAPVDAPADLIAALEKTKEDLNSLQALGSWKIVPTETISRIDAALAKYKAAPVPPVDALTDERLKEEFHKGIDAGFGLTKIRKTKNGFYALILQIMPDYMIGYVETQGCTVDGIVPMKWNAFGQVLGAHEDFDLTEQFAPPRNSGE